MKFMILIGLLISSTSCKEKSSAEAKIAPPAVRTCVSANAIMAVQTWSGNSWGSCNVIKCHSGHILMSNSCIQLKSVSNN